MAKRSVVITTITPTATADTTDLVDSTYPFLLQGGSATQLNSITEIYLGGQAASVSSPTFMLLSMDSQVASGSNTRGTGQTDTPLNMATAALGAVAITGNANATNKPRRAATLHLLNLSLNAYGGIVRWTPYDASEAVTLIGNAVNVGEASVSAFTGGTPGALGGHMIYETA